MNSSIYNFTRHLRIAAAAAFAAGILALAPAAGAAGPENQQPGFYRYALGDYTVTAVYEGFIDLDPAHLSGMTQGEIQVHVARAFQAKNSTIQTSVNAFRIDTGDKLVLVDSGSTDCFGPTMGRMLESIRAAGYSAGDVDDVLLTHLHPDHACGVTNAEGKMAFPNATVWADKDDADFWLDSGTVDKLPKEQKSFVAMAQHALAPYQAAGRLRLFNEGDSLPAGIKAVSSASHTPGHTSYLVHSQTAALMVWGTWSMCIQCRCLIPR